MNRRETLLNWFKKGGSGTDKEIAAIFGTKPYVIRSYVSYYNNDCGEHITKRRVHGKRKQEYYIPFAKDKPKAKAAKVSTQPQYEEGLKFSFIMDGMMYDAYPRHRVEFVAK